jgi:halocyanin-like protein
MTRTRLTSVDVDRRTVLKTLGVAAAGALAGCSGSAPEGDAGGGGTSGSGGGEGESTPEPTGTPSGDGGDSGSDSGSGSEPSFDGWFDGVGNFDGVVDRTGQSEVEVTVGAEGNGGNFAFAPAAVRVDSGTTVVWRWTGKGSTHNVVDEGGSFESELVAEEGHTFSHTFEESGTVKYVCTPHRAVGMKGAVVVE